MQPVELEEDYLITTTTCRRAFLKSSLYFAATLLFAKSSLAKVWDGASLPKGKISLHNINNNERLTVTYRNELGEYDSEALKALNWVLRCHSTNETTSMDLRVIEYLNRLDHALGGGNEIQIISGYRSPSYNGKLRSVSQGVAKHSLHMKGKAIDLAIAGIGLDTIRRTALSFSAGGVGYYPRGGFVHIDSGAIRAWHG
jgi:uncharacterized protein YcbK (DUF882 family)